MPSPLSPHPFTLETSLRWPFLFFLISFPSSPLVPLHSLESCSEHACLLEDFFFFFVMSHHLRTFPLTLPHVLPPHRLYESYVPWSLFRLEGFLAFFLPPQASLSCGSSVVSSGPRDGSSRSRSPWTKCLKYGSPSLSGDCY